MKEEKYGNERSALKTTAKTDAFWIKSNFSKLKSFPLSIFDALEQFTIKFTLTPPFSLTRDQV